MDAHLHALGSSLELLAALVTPLEDNQLKDSGYPTEWSVADVVSHIGSGAVISLRRLEDSIAGTTTPDDFAPSVWDEWNAKPPRSQAVDALAAERDLLRRMAGLTPEERSRFQMTMGPMVLDAMDFFAMRLNEHALHTWDIAVALDPSATIPAESTALVVDNLGLVAGFSAQPTGHSRTITVTTTEPERSFTITLGPESVAFGRSEAPASPDLTMPAEALVRLVYGRLDPAHTPDFTGDSGLLDELRRVFRGI